MYWHDKRLQYPVTIEWPDPTFARMLQQVSDGIVGAVRSGHSAKASIEGLIHKNLLSGGLAAMPIDSMACRST